MAKKDDTLTDEEARILAGEAVVTELAIRYAMRAFDMDMLAQGMGFIVPACADNQKEKGPGVLICRFKHDPEPTIDVMWKTAASIEQAPDAEMPDAVRAIAGRADVGKGLLAVMLLYSDRLGVYLLSTMTGPSWRELSRPFAILDEFSVRKEDAHEERPAGPAYMPRPEDLEGDDDFL